METPNVRLALHWKSVRPAQKGNQFGAGPLADFLPHPVGVVAVSV